MSDKLSLFITTSLSPPLLIGSIAHVFFYIWSILKLWIFNGFSTQHGFSSTKNIATLILPNSSTSSSTHFATFFSFIFQWVTHNTSFFVVLSVSACVFCIPFWAFFCFPTSNVLTNHAPNSFSLANMAKVAFFMLFHCGLFQWVWKFWCFCGHFREEIIY